MTKEKRKKKEENRNKNKRVKKMYLSTLGEEGGVVSAPGERPGAHLFECQRMGVYFLFYKLKKEGKMGQA